MSKASFRQAARVVTTIAREKWPSEIVDTFCNNWGVHRDLTIALHTGLVSANDVNMLFLEASKGRGGETLRAKCRTFKTGQYVNRMVKAGYHVVARAPDGIVGMAASAYKNLWPKEVVLPLEYEGRFDAILCVDASIPQDELVARGYINDHVKPSSCTDIVSAPTDGKKNFFVRYIAFVQLGKKNLRRSVEDCTRTFAQDEIGLVTREGLHLPVEHKDHLRKYGVDLAGSRRGSARVPCVDWFGDGRVGFNTDDGQVAYDDYGSGSRGSKVVAVP